MSAPAEGKGLARARGEAKARRARPRASEGADDSAFCEAIKVRRRPKGLSARDCARPTSERNDRHHWRGGHT